MSGSKTLAALALAAGSLLLLAARTRPVRIAPPPTFSNEVVRIFQQSCQGCHHPGDIAPFSLMSYAEARPWAASIRHMVSTRQMPPWKPSPSCTKLQGERRLTDADVATIVRWVDAGSPEGDRAQLPPPLTFPDGWILGTPDLTVTLPEPYTPPNGADTYRCFVVPTDAASTRAVTAIDTHPGNREIVHHVIAYLDTSGEAERLDAADPQPGYSCFGGPGFTPTGALGGWAPGSRPYELPEGVALQLPAKARVVIQVHYHPHHAAGADQTSMAIYFAKTPVEQWLRLLPLANTTFNIPAGADNHPVSAVFQLPPFVSAKLWSITPHMHLLGRTIRVDALRPDGSSSCLISIDDWDFNWQGTYLFDEPVALPAGTLLSLRATFDNSSRNPDNPNNPPKDVRWGEATTDEMCLAFLGFTIDGERASGDDRISYSTGP
jgi:mono/diheme cytochrome c family protein